LLRRFECVRSLERANVLGAQRRMVRAAKGHTSARNGVRIKNPRLRGWCRPERGSSLV